MGSQGGPQVPVSQRSLPALPGSHESCPSPPGPTPLLFLASLACLLVQLEPGTQLKLPPLIQIPLYTNNWLPWKCPWDRAEGGEGRRREGEATGLDDCHFSRSPRSCPDIGWGVWGEGSLRSPVHILPALGPT